jgi:hypothetical protein
MTISSKFAKCFILLLLTLSWFTQAEPYLAYKNNLKCAACHVNPNGGGARSDFGRIYGQSVLPVQPLAFDTNELAKISSFLNIGMDARFNATFQNDDNDNDTQSFDLGSALVYLDVNIADTGLSFYLDEQVGPGSAINREAYVKYKFDNNHFIKAGKMFLPYGLRVEDDGAFIRQATGMNFDNGDNGVELGLEYSQATVNLFVSNGTSGGTNDDDNFLYGIRGEHLFSNFRIGATGVINDRDKQTTMLNLYGGAQFGDFTFLASIDSISLEAANQFNGLDIDQLATLIEMNYQWKQGWNFKLTAEHFDPDRDVDEDEQTRYSFVTEYTPLSSLQLRLGIRSNEDIPQKPQQNFEVFFVQGHFYF